MFNTGWNKVLNYALAIIVVISLTIGCNGEKVQSDELELFIKYYSATKENDGRKWNFTADTVKLWFDDKESQPIIQVKGIGSAGIWQEWDQQMNASSRYDTLWFDKEERAIKGYFYENNDFYRLIGKGPTKTLQTYWLDNDNKIEEILIYWIPEENTTTAEHLEPIVDWALKYDSTEISELYPNGKIVPSKENAQRWIKLLEKYKETQNADYQ